ALAASHVLTALGDADEAVREHAVLLSEKVYSRAGSLTGDLQKKLRKLAADPSPRVRYQLAFTFGEINPPDKVEAIAEIVQRDSADQWIRAATLSSLAHDAAKVFTAVVGNESFRNSAGGQEFLRQLTGVIGAQNNSTEVSAVLSRLGDIQPPASFAVVRGLGDGLQRAGSSLAKAG